jgi:hypothetical protein
MNYTSKMTFIYKAYQTSLFFFFFFFFCINQTEFLGTLTGAKLKTLENTNPLDQKHFADPQFADMAL